MSFKSFTLISGNENGWQWSIRVTIREDGVIESRGYPETYNNKEYYKRYNQNNIKERKQHYQDNKNQINEYSKQYYLNNKKEVKECNERYGKSKNGREIARKHSHKHRGLGSVYINDWFEGCECHHISLEEIIHIPKELHRSIWHNVWNGYNMDLINDLAFEFLLGELGDC